MVNILSETPLEKTDFFFSSGLLADRFWLGEGTLVQHFLFSLLGPVWFELVWASVLPQFL